MTQYEYTPNVLVIGGTNNNELQDLIEDGVLSINETTGRTVVSQLEIIPANLNQTLENIIQRLETLESLKNNLDVTN